MNNILYNIFAVIGMLNCTAFLVVILVVLYCWLADMWFYYFGNKNSISVNSSGTIKDDDLLTIKSRDGTIIRRVARYEPMEHQPVDLSVYGSMSNSSAETIAKSFSGGRYR